MSRSFALCVSLVLLLLSAGCERRVFPRIDVSYSEYLSVVGRNYETVAGRSASTTVDVVQVFSGAGVRDLTDLADVTGRKLILESRIRDVIDGLISAIQHSETNEKISCDIAGEATWILVAYDTALFRAGVIRLYACGSGSEMFLGVRPVGDAAITYSREGAAMVRSLGLTEVGQLSPK